MKLPHWAALFAALTCFASPAGAGEVPGNRPLQAKPTTIDYQACDGLSEGEQAEYSMAGGRMFIGTCQAVDGRLAAVPVNGAEKGEPLIESKPQPRD